MREYLIFKVKIDNEVYIDAYRIDDKPIDWIPFWQLDKFAYVCSPSRIEAKRAAWVNWISSSLNGFDEWHKRAMNKKESNVI